MLVMLISFNAPFKLAQGNPVELLKDVDMEIPNGEDLKSDILDVVLNVDSWPSVNAECWTLPDQSPDAVRDGFRDARLHADPPFL
jgi:hypothetical protein